MGLFPMLAPALISWVFLGKSLQGPVLQLQGTEPAMELVLMPT